MVGNAIAIIQAVVIFRLEFTHIFKLDTLLCNIFSSMYIKKLNLSNYRGFKKLSLDIPQDLCVFIGVNGSGKSTILDGIAVLLKVFVYALEHIVEPWQVELISENDISLKQNSMNLESAVHFDESIINKNQEIVWRVTLDKSNIEQKYSVQSSDLQEYIKLLQRQLFSREISSVPLLLYYKANRVSDLQSSESKKTADKLKYVDQQPTLFDAFQISVPNYSIPQLQAYDNAFVQGIYSYQDFENWFRVQEDYENERKLRENPDYRNPSLEIVRTALETFFSHFTNTNYSRLRIVRIPNFEEVRFTRHSMQASLTISKDDQDLQIEQLSDGERMCLIMVADIARRLAIANPTSDIEALQGSGIILIDEVEAHLHPQWQREIVPSLRKTFPKCQFIVTTHSPQVLSNIPNENIFILEDFQVLAETPPNYGRDSNSILFDLMNVTKRPAFFQQKVNQCFELIDENKLAEAKALLRELEDNFGEQDADIIRAKSEIEFTKQLDEID